MTRVPSTGQRLVPSAPGYRPRRRQSSYKLHTSPNVPTLSCCILAQTYATSQASDRLKNVETVAVSHDQTSDSALMYIDAHSPSWIGAWKIDCPVKICVFGVMTTEEARVLQCEPVVNLQNKSSSLHTCISRVSIFISSVHTNGNELLLTNAIEGSC